MGMPKFKKIYIFGEKIMSGILWTKKELKKLKHLYLTKGLCHSEISKIITTHSYNSIKIKIVRSGWRHTKQQEFSCRSRIHKGKLNPMYGLTAWSNGQTKETNIILKQASKQISKTRKILFKCGKLPNIKGKNNPMYGKPAWNYDKTKFDTPTIMVGSKKQSKTMKKLWNKLPQDEKDRRIGNLTKCMLEQYKKDTFIEKKVEQFLKLHNIKYKKEYKIGKFFIDFYLPKYNVCIECQGDYWHANPYKYDRKNLKYQMQKDNVRRDKIKYFYLKRNNVTLLNLWEYEIRKNFDRIKSKILQVTIDAK